MNLIKSIWSATPRKSQKMAARLGRISTTNISMWTTTPLPSVLMILTIFYSALMAVYTSLMTASSLGALSTTYPLRSSTKSLSMTQSLFIMSMAAHRIITPKAARRGRIIVTAFAILTGSSRCLPMVTNQRLNRATLILCMPNGRRATSPVLTEPQAKSSIFSRNPAKMNRASALTGTRRFLLVSTNPRGFISPRIVCGALIIAAMNGQLCLATSPAMKTVCNSLLWTVNGHGSRAGTSWLCPNITPSPLSASRR